MSTRDALGLGRLLPGPGWLVIDAAREQRFTGEVVLLADEAVRIYFDRGRVYLAERASDPPLGNRLVESGAISEQQLEYGRLQVQDADHLGRLFDRVPNVSRDSVLTVTDLMNERTLAWLANQQVQSAGVAPYRHHSSGLHHWLDSPPTSLAAPWPAPTLTVPGSRPADPIDHTPTAAPTTTPDSTPAASRPAASRPAAPAQPPEPEPSAPEPTTPADPEPAVETSPGAIGVTADEIVTWDVPDPFGKTAPNRFPGRGHGPQPGHPDRPGEPATEFFGVIWPTGEVDDLGSTDRPDPDNVPAVDPIPPEPPVTPTPPSDDADTLAVRRAVATIDTGSLAARRRLLESTQPAAPPVMGAHTRTSVFDEPGPEPRPESPSQSQPDVDPTETTVSDERDAQHRERARALRRMISGLRRE